MLAALLLAVAACQRTDPDPGPGNEICLNANTMQDDATKATVVNSDSDLQSKDITVYGYFHGSSPYRNCFYSDMHYSSGTWEFINGSGDQVHFYWPIEGSYISSTAVSSLDFFGWCPSELPSYIPYFNPTLTGPIFQCSSLPVSSATQAATEEFLYAYLPDITYEDQVNAGGAISLEFIHPFAIINLDVKTSHRAVYNLNTITFKDIKNSGTYTHNNVNKWATSGYDTDFSLTLADGIAEDAALTSSQKSTMGCPAIVLPQTLVTTNQIEVKLTWNDGDAEQTYTFNNPVSEWQPGKVYNYTLDLLGEIKFSVTIDDWSAEETPRNIRF